MEAIIGRISEQKQLAHLLESHDAELLALYSKSNEQRRTYPK